MLHVPSFCRDELESRRSSIAAALLPLVTTVIGTTVTYLRPCLANWLSFATRRLGLPPTPITTDGLAFHRRLPSKPDEP